MSTYQINLSTLPSDIVRKVVNFAGMATFEEMRLISHHWNETALAHIEVRANRPVINVCRWWPHNTAGNKRPYEKWSRHRNRSHHNDWNMEIEIAKEHVNYFGLDGWNITNKPSESEDKVQLDRRLTGVQEPRMRERIVRLFSRCIRVEKFEVDFSGEEDVKSLSEIAGATIIDNLEILRVKGHLPQLEKTTFTLIEQHSVQTFTLKDNWAEKEYMESFIKKAMSLVAKFEWIIVDDTINVLAAVLRWAYWKRSMENIKSRLAQFNVRTEDSVQQKGFKNLRIIIERIGA